MIKYTFTFVSKYYAKHRYKLVKNTTYQFVSVVKLSTLKGVNGCAIFRLIRYTPQHYSYIRWPNFIVMDSESVESINIQVQHLILKDFLTKLGVELTQYER